MSGPETSFEQEYWTEHSAYRKFEEYVEGLEGTRRWYAGLPRLIGRHLPPPGARVLDAGCGHGALVHLLHERGYRVTGVDTSEWIIEQARRHAPELADSFVHGDVASLPAGEPFDAIVCLEVLEHIPEPVGVLREFHDRLAPGGRLIATTPNLRPLMPWWDPLTSDPTHVSVHEPSWWAKAAERAGFEVERAGTFITVPVIWRYGAALSRWIPLGRRTGPGGLLVARRPG